ncbi:Eco57I restriction-modification methylase domain-containing protein [Pseudomonas gingeri]|uniref:site-specific DNA-methyltransferase (adenine-specific) n=1 Tax=Pseudomonas gingeri TaxID=117681 RepID=A0A7Y7WW70_9PSED|nr:Eco57I restriction-modification methylase domain-containing protein [Pseudomonas gingeri]NWB88416.1 Eco57I restriction-modification methylase domain-containing protein [Pseudomonas gingeri]
MSLQNSIEVSVVTELTSKLKEGSVDGYGLVENAEYLIRGQVDTPIDVVDIVWKIAHRYRARFGKVIDAGAGDGRFSTKGMFDSYCGFEIDQHRVEQKGLPSNASIERACAFSGAVPEKYDLSIGNPPYVRHHDISDEWRSNIADWIEEQVGVKPSGLSNAYIYFLWLSLIVTRSDGVVVLLIPSEWTARPVNKQLREYIKEKGWTLDIYKFENDPFPRVLTTGSVTVIDKHASSGEVHHFLIDAQGAIKSLFDEDYADQATLPYVIRDSQVFAQRGFSPGGQSVFVLTESERALHDLREGEDVIPCITTLRHISNNMECLDRVSFELNYVGSGKRCWLISPAGTESESLRRYLDSVPMQIRDNYTCRKRPVWWKYSRPKIPSLLYSSGFRGRTTKVLKNELGVVNVGAVCGIYTRNKRVAAKLARAIKSADLEKNIVAVSRGFTKIEVNQMNAFIQQALEN